MHIQSATMKMVNECLVVNAGCGWIERYYVFGMLTTSMKWKHAILIKYFEKEEAIRCDTMFGRSVTDSCKISFYFRFPIERLIPREAELK